MSLRVECYAGYRGDESPRRLVLGDRAVDVEVIDRWVGPDHRYFKLRAAGGAVYVVRHDLDSGEWDLDSFEDAPG